MKHANHDDKPCIARAHKAAYKHLKPCAPEALPDSKDWDSNETQGTGKPETSLQDLEMDKAVVTVWRKHDKILKRSIKAFLTHPAVRKVVLDERVTDKYKHRVKSAFEELVIQQEPEYKNKLQRRLPGLANSASSVKLSRSGSNVPRNLLIWNPEPYHFPGETGDVQYHRDFMPRVLKPGVPQHNDGDAPESEGLKKRAVLRSAKA